MRFLHPKFYLTWLLLFVLWVLAHLPFGFQRLLSIIFGFFLYQFMQKRRKIAKINIDLCFKDTNQAYRKKLLKKHFLAFGSNVIAIANSFYLSKKRTQKVCQLKGRQYLDDALAQKKPIMLLTGHWTSMLFAGCVVQKTVPMADIFRPQNNALFDTVMQKQFQKRGIKMIVAKDSRSIIKTLKSGTPIWYAHDQDLGEKNSVFAPFFDIETATITATAKLAKLTHAIVIPVKFYQAESQFIFEFDAPLKNYPSGNADEDAKLTNSILEKQVLGTPEQYFWVHKRFKTRPKLQKKIY